MLTIEHRQMPYQPTDNWLLLEKMAKPKSTIIVDVNDWEQSKGRLVTYSAAVCIILAAFNTSTREGVLGHFMTMQGSEPEELVDEMTEAIRSSGDTAMTHIWLGGGARFSEEFYRGMEVNKAIALDKARALNPGRLDTQWLKDGEEAMHIDLDPPNAHLLVRTELSS